MNDMIIKKGNFGMNVWLVCVIRLVCVMASQDFVHT